MAAPQSVQSGEVPGQRPHLLVVTGSTRPGRTGGHVTGWFAAVARRHGGFDVTVADLADPPLPLLDEPAHPRFGSYEHEHTKRWAATVSAAEAVVFVIPEYNHSFPASVKNAIDFLYEEWAGKPVGFVSYGGLSGGTRAVAALGPVVMALRMVPCSPSVAIPFVLSAVGDDGTFQVPDRTATAATALIDDLARLCTLLGRPARLPT
jgi:NAD(P)H-dependent FMN reductase